MIRNIVNLSEVPGSPPFTFLCQEDEPQVAVMDALVRFADQLAERKGGGILSLEPPTSRRIENVELRGDSLPFSWTVSAALLIGGATVEVTGSIRRPDQIGRKA